MTKVQRDTIIKRATTTIMMKRKGKTKNITRSQDFTKNMKRERKERKSQPLTKKETIKKVIALKANT
jgi:hypothetical protein